MALINDCTSNNTINENRYNESLTKMHKFKKLLKPILAYIKKQSKKNTYRRASSMCLPTDCCQCEYETEQNDQNERLHAKICAEIDACEDGYGVPMYTTHYGAGCRVEQVNVIPVAQGHHFVPVRFAKTDAGTFFWTTMAPVDADVCCYGDRFAISAGQFAEEQVRLYHPGDRWAQA